MPPSHPTILLSGPARLRRLSIAEVLDSALQLYRANFRAFSTAVASVEVTYLPVLYVTSALLELLLEFVGDLAVKQPPIGIQQFYARNKLVKARGSI